MRKLVLIATLSLGALALAQTANWQNRANQQQNQANQQNQASQPDQTNQMQAGNDWYNQRLSAQAQQFVSIKAAMAPSETASAQGGEQPGSMAANAGAQGEDWYNQELAAQVQGFQRIKAAAAPAPTESAE